jgi:diguanylate cyclase (GGDEF)-like protein
LEITNSLIAGVFMLKVTTEPGNSGKAVLSLASQQDMQKIPRIGEVTSCLLRKLQTSLDVDELLAWFLSSVSSLIGAINCKLTTEQSEFTVSEIKKARHKANYNLTVEDQLLGTIEFSRNKRFSETDLVTLETLLGYLIYPLRNALNYRDAVNAAMSDALTGAANKRAFDYQIHHEVAISQRYQSSLSLAVFDIDFFKKINDGYGHATGDAVLRQIVDVVKLNCRDSDLVFRLGGEEFGLLLTKTDPAGAYAIADRIRQAISETTFCHDGYSIPVTISMGISTHNSSDSKSSFMGRADKALYSAKNSGRNKTIMADDTVNQNTVNSTESNERVG